MLFILLMIIGYGAVAMLALKYNKQRKLIREVDEFLAKLEKSKGK